MKETLLGLLLMIGLLPLAHAAQLDATLLEGQEQTQPSFEFLRVIYIEYPEGGEISDLLKGQKIEITFDANESTTGMKEFISKLNQNLKSIPSNAIVSDAKLHYQAILQGNEKNTVIEYKVTLMPTIENYILFNEADKSTIDVNWRGIFVSDAVWFETKYGKIDVNNPKSALDIMIPEVSKNLSVSIIEMPLIDASGIKKLPLLKWHSLFDNTAIIPQAKEYKYTGENVITHYSMGECTIFIGACDDREWTEQINLDKKYTIRIIESRDDATIAIEGYADSTVINGIEMFQTDLKSSIIQGDDPNEFLTTIMYGMTGMAVIGAIGIMVLSNRKLKQVQNQGQTGIDPSHLTAYETSISAGGYKTNRGEASLKAEKISKMAI